MKNDIGVWINHEKAIIVTYSDEGGNYLCIESNVEGHFRLSGGSRSASPYGPQDVASEHKIEERRRHHLHNFYQNIIEEIKNAKRLFIFGPGEAKKELQNEMKKIKAKMPRILKAEAADKMTERQIVVKVRKFYDSLKK